MGYMKEIIAKKKFGQNFLTDTTILTKIVEAMPKSDRVIVEIGPGLGDLTNYLVRVKSVVAFEVDTDLCAHLTTKFEEELKTEHLTLKCGDVLRVWRDKQNADKTLIDAGYDMVANLPYYIATNIILHALSDPNCHSLLVMIQKEVADKFSAQPGEKAFSALSVLTQTVGTAKTVITVPPTAFNPPPKVDSAVIRIDKNGKVFSKEFSSFLKTAFAQPRKTLAKNLSQRFDKETIKESLKALKLSPTVRPHETTTTQFHQLFEQL